MLHSIEHANFNGDFRLFNIGVKEIIKDFNQNGIMKDFFEKYIEKWESDMNINMFVEKLELSDIMYNIINGNVFTSLYYSLPNDAAWIIKIELNEKMKLHNISYENPDASE